MNLADIRTRLAGLEGRTYWRSLEELADTPEFREYVEREFPAQASEFTDPAGRRQFLKLMGASLALAGVSACTRQPEEKIVPYVRQPEEIIPGRPLFYATAMPQGGYAHARCSPKTTWAGRRSSRAIPSIRRASAPRTSSARRPSSALYDPDRSRTIIDRGEVADVGRVPGGAAGRDRRRGRRIERPGPAHSDRADHVAVAPRTDQDAARRDAAKPSGISGMRSTARARAARRRATPLYRFDKADVVVSLDADFLGFGPGVGALHQGLLVAPPDRHARRRAQPAVRRRAGPDDHRREGRSSSRAQGARRSRVCRRARRRGRRVGAGVGGAARCRRAARSGSPPSRPIFRRTRAVGRRRRRTSAGRRARARARDERRARQHRRDGHLRRADRRHRRPTARRRSPSSSPT